MSADLGPLFIAPPPRRVLVERTTAEQRRALFEKFHAENPRIYAELVQMARELVSQGHGRIGIRMLWEVLRWSALRTSRPETAPKMNDWFPPFYARLISLREADLREVFETRTRE